MYSKLLYMILLETVSMQTCTMYSSLLYIVLLEIVRHVGHGITFTHCFVRTFFLLFYGKLLYMVLLETVSMQTNVNKSRVCVCFIPTVLLAL